MKCFVKLKDDNRVYQVGVIDFVGKYLSVNVGRSSQNVLLWRNHNLEEIEKIWFETKNVDVYRRDYGNS